MTTRPSSSTAARCASRTRLDEIAALLDDEGLELIETVRRHLERVERDLERQRRLRDRLMHILDALEHSLDPTPDQFMDAMEAMTVIPTTACSCMSPMKMSTPEPPRRLTRERPRVVIETLEENAYHATVVVADGESHGVDARPSDAFNVAARLGAPIFVDAEVMDQHGIPAAKARRWLEERDAGAQTAGEWQPLSPDRILSL